MNQTKFVAILAVIVLGLIAISATLYTVDEREKTIVIRLGQVVRYDDKPGLHVKVPIIYNVRFFDSRILTMDADARPFLTVEKKNVRVDSFVKWRIVDTKKYYLAVGGDELRARTRLEQLVNSGLRDEFGKRTVHEVVSGDRAKIMEILRLETDKEAREYGIEVVDVRIKRVDLPDEVSQSVYNRMEAERGRIAKELRAQGAEAAEKIRAGADRKREVILAEAYRDAERIRGEGDAKATATYGRAYNTNPRFYSFYRSLIAYRQSFSNKEDIMIIDPSSDFFKYLKKPSGGRQ